MLLIACHNSKTTTETMTQTTTATETETVSGGLSTSAGQGIIEPINQTVPDEDTVILLGKINRKGLNQEPFQSWFDLNFEDATLDKKTIAKIKPLLEGVRIKAFMGTWCSDSQREIPHFYKIMDAAGFNYDRLDLVAMSQDKDTPAAYENGLNIINVPTFIFYKNGKELGRYVEYAQETLEKDMYAILSGADYTHSYAE